MRVFKNKFGRWDTLFKSKMLNGEEVKFYMPVQFQRGFEPSKDSIDIDVLKWWGSAYLKKVVNRDGSEDHIAAPKLFIADWREIIPNETDKAIDESIEEYKQKANDEEVNFKADDLPFY